MKILIENLLWWIILCTEEVSLPGNQISSVNTITVTLIPIFTKWDCPRRRGLRPPYNVVDAAPHQAAKVIDLPASHQNSKDGRRTKIKDGSL